MRSEDIENDIKRLLAAKREKSDIDRVQRQITCRVSALTFHKLGLLSSETDITKTALAERLLDQATAVAWSATGLPELSDAEVKILSRPITASSGGDDREGKSLAAAETNGNEFSRVNCILAVFRSLSIKPGRVTETKAIAVSSDSSVRICCLTSKDYEAEKSMPEGESFWFTIYEDQLEVIQRATKSYVAFGCGNVAQIVLIPADVFEGWCESLPRYTRGKTGWHVKIDVKNGNWNLRREGRGVPPIEVTKYVI